MRIIHVISVFRKERILLAFVMLAFNSYSQTYEFNNAGASGRFGPTQAQVNAAYSSTNLANSVTINTQGIQEWTVPASLTYRISAIGACGGEGQGVYYPGKPGTGATITGDFFLTQGTVVKIVVGQKGTYANNGSGGGGGSFVFTGTSGGNGLLLAAGGGGGHGHGTSAIPTGAHGGGGGAAQFQVNGAFGTGNGGSNGVGHGGKNGIGCGTFQGSGSGGAGWLSDGDNSPCTNPSQGGNHTTYVGGSSGSGCIGGFGGGGGANGNGTPGGGGGGYTGGGGGNKWNGSAWGAGAGAGSYNGGSNQVNIAGVTGALSGYNHGSVTITRLYSVFISQDSNILCHGESTAALSSEVNGGTPPYTYLWNTGDTFSSISGLDTGIYSVTVTDSLTNVTSGSFLVTQPTELIASLGFKQDILCPDDENGIAFITANLSGTPPYTFAWDDGSNNAINQNLSLGQFICTVTDSGNCTSTYIDSIVSLDSLTPSVSAQNLTVYLDTLGFVGIAAAQVNNGSNDNCVIDTMYLNTTEFDCSDIGINSVTLTVADQSGNSDVITASVTVVDTISPTVIAQNLTVYLDALGSASVMAAQIDNGSSDNCTIDSRVLDETNFDCLDVGVKPVLLTVTDDAGNSSSTTADVTVLDTISPTAVTQNLTVNLDVSGTASITAAQVDNGSFDNCAIDSIYLDVIDFNCSDTGFNIVTLHVADVNGNVDSNTAVINVQDVTAPNLNAQDVIIYLDANGEAFTYVDSVRVSASDQCLIDTTFLSDSLFFCDDVGSNTVSITAIDFSGNSTTVSVNVEVLDTISPTILAVDTVIYLDASGQATLDTSYVNAGSFDNCGIASFALDTTNFTCENAGDILTVTLTVTDVNGNTSDTSVLVKILDTVAPIAITQNITVQLDVSGNVSIDSSMINDGSTDACGIASIVLSDTAFDCSDVGDNLIEMYVTDSNGNSDTATAIVTVEDTVAPFAFAFDSLIVYLDSFGSFSIDVEDIDSASADTCGIDTMFISQYDYDCSDIGAPITLTLTVEDSNGNVSTDQTFVTVLDTIAPHIIIVNDTVYLDASGLATVDSSNFDAGTWDNCGIATLQIDTANLSCDPTVDSILVVMTALDIYGNSSVDSSFLFVLDTILPTIACIDDTVLLNDSGQCAAVFVFDTASAFDNCLIDTVIRTDSSGLISGDEFPVGTTTIQFTAIDEYGNEDSCSFTVTVIDTQAPEIICPSDTIICDSAFTFMLPVIIDNCPNDSIEQILGIASGELYPVGLTVNTFVVTDASGLTDTCSFEVIRNDFPSAAITGFDTALCDTTIYTIDAIDPIIGNGAWTSLGAAPVANDSINVTAVSGLLIGSNSFVWTVVNGVCDPNTDTIDIVVDERPTIANLPSAQSLCDFDETEFTANVPTVGTGVWSTSSSLDLSDTLSETLSITNIPLGNHKLYWTISNGTCPPSVDSTMIYNNVIPVVDAGDNVSRFAGKDVTFNPIVTDASIYAWTPAELFDDPTLLSATASVLESTLLKITVSSDSGCSASDSLLYSVNSLDSVPTGITPNGDDINDVWNIPELNTYPDAEIYVFDQAGRQVYFSKGYETPWDGSYNGQLLPRASYFWIIDLKDGVNEPLRGIISIIR